MVLNTTFNNIFVTWWRSVLLEKETGVPGENHPVQSKVTDKPYHIMFYRIHLARVEFELTTLLVIGTDCTSSYKSNCHTITVTTDLHRNIKMSLRFN